MISQKLHHQNEKEMKKRLGDGGQVAGRVSEVQVAETETEKVKFTVDLGFEMIME